MRVGPETTMLEYFPHGFFKPKAIAFTDEFDRLRKAIFLYSCQQKVTGVTATILRDKLVTLMAIYMQRGYDRASKTFAQGILGVDDKAIASMNLELRKAGLLHKSPMNVRMNNLTKDIELLRDYILREGKDEATILFKLERGEA